MTKLHSTYKQLALAVAIGLLAMAGAPSAFAQDHGKGHDKHHQDDRHRPRVDPHYRKAVAKHYKLQRKAKGHWDRGQHIPREYIVERYYVRDYRTYDLAPPPYGYRWVRAPPDNNYYLVQVATGLISQIFGL